MNEKVIMAGFGGQGVMSMGRLLTYAGMLEDKYVSWLPSYGPEMRGGTANCNVIVSDDMIASPIITEATAAIVMNRPSLEKFEGSIKSGGHLFVNSSLIEQKPKRDDVNIYNIPANEIANDLGNSKIANMVMLGAYVAITGIVSNESIMNSLKKVLGPKKEHLLDINEEALKKGAECVK